MWMAGDRQVYCRSVLMDFFLPYNGCDGGSWNFAFQRGYRQHGCEAGCYCWGASLCRTCVLWRPAWIWNGGLQRAGGIHVYPVSQCEHGSFFFFFPVEFQLVSPLKKRPKCCKILFLNPVNCIYTEIVRKSVHYLRPFSISRILWWWPRTCLADLLTTTVWW